MTGRTFREKVIEAQQLLGLSNRELSRRAWVSCDIARLARRMPRSYGALSIDEGLREPPDAFSIKAGAGHGIVVYDESAVASLAFPPGVYRLAGMVLSAARKRPHR